MTILSLTAAPRSGRGSVLRRLNGEWHRRALAAFMAVVLAHWAEHLLQAWQIWAMGMPRHQALGALGTVWPWLVHSEWLHYGYALVMLAGLLVLYPGMAGRARTWWGIALALQFWHHLEHGLLLAQVMGGWRLGGGTAPTSLIQLVVPRVELHLFYNSVVFVPMVVGMAYHLWPSASEAARVTCGCALHHARAAAAVLIPLLLGTMPLAAQEDAPPRGTLTTGVVLTHERWDRYWEGTLLRANGNLGAVTTQSAAVVLGYGVTERWSVAAALPYVRTRASQGTLRGMQGVQDVHLAARYRLLSTSLAGGRMTAAATGAVGVPAADYSPDFLPLSIGLGSRRASARLSAGWEAPRAGSLHASAAYTWRGPVRLDRDAWYTDGRLHLGNRVPMPDVADATVGAGFRAGRLHLPVSVTAQRTLGGGDIRRQDAPFVSNRMDFVRVDAGLGYALPGGLALRLGAGRVLHGRNVGRASTVSAGLVHTLRPGRRSGP
jgi:hypothetical protein